MAASSGPKLTAETIIINAFIILIMKNHFLTAEATDGNELAGLF